MDCQNRGKKILQQYGAELKKLDEDLQIQYGEYISLLQKDYEIFLSLIEDAFSTDIYTAFEDQLGWQNVGTNRGNP